MGFNFNKAVKTKQQIEKKKIFWIFRLHAWEPFSTEKNEKNEKTKKKNFF